MKNRICCQVPVENSILEFSGFGVYAGLLIFRAVAEPRDSGKSPEIGRFFREFVPKNPAKFDVYSRDLSEALSMRTLKGNL